VKTPSGYRNIEDIRAGDRVFSYNETTKRLEVQTVAQTFIRKTDRIYTLVYDTGTKLQTTATHPFYIEGKGWVKAADLHVGDDSLLSREVSQLDVYGGARLQNVSYRQSKQGVIVGITVEERAETVYNFEVNETHTYLVGDADVVVHNAGYNVTVDANGNAVLNDSGSVFLKGDKNNAKLQKIVAEDGSVMYVSADGKQRIIEKSGCFGFCKTSTVSVTDQYGNVIETDYKGSAEDIKEGPNNSKETRINGQTVQSGGYITQGKDGKYTVIAPSTCAESDAQCRANYAAQLPTGVYHTNGVDTDPKWAMEQAQQVKSMAPGQNVVLHYVQLGETSSFGSGIFGGLWAANELREGNNVMPTEVNTLRAAIEAGKATDLTCYSGGCAVQGTALMQVDKDNRKGVTWTTIGGAQNESLTPDGLQSAQFYFTKGSGLKSDDYVSWPNPPVGNGSSTDSQKAGITARNPNYRFVNLPSDSYLPTDAHNFYEYMGGANGNVIREGFKNRRSGK
jgi:hypothetical protein